jgi:hypothetical protein
MKFPLERTLYPFIGYYRGFSNKTVVFPILIPLNTIVYSLSSPYFPIATTLSASPTQILGESDGSGRTLLHLCALVVTLAKKGGCGCG